MARFIYEFTDTHGYLAHPSVDKEVLSPDDLLEVLRPAGLKLKEFYKEAVLSRFRRRTGSLADSFDIEDNYLEHQFVSIIVKPFGTHKRGKYTRKSRAGSSTRKYAKHGRSVSTKAIKNEELMWLLEHGTPRIPASHLIQNTNDRVMDEIQDIVEDGFTDLLKQKGLI